MNIVHTIVELGSSRTPVFEPPGVRFSRGTPPVHERSPGPLTCSQLILQ